MKVRWNGHDYLLSQEAEGMLNRLLAYHEKLDQVRDQVVEAEVRQQIARSQRLDKRKEALREGVSAQILGGPNDGA